MDSRDSNFAEQYKRKCCRITKPYKPVCSLPHDPTEFRSLGTGFRSGQRRIINPSFFSGRSLSNLSLFLYPTATIHPNEMPAPHKFLPDPKAAAVSLIDFQARTLNVDRVIVQIVGCPFRYLLPKYLRFVDERPNLISLRYPEPAKYIFSVNFELRD